MTVSSSFSNANNEIKKAIKTRRLTPSFANAFIALIIAIFDRIKQTFRAVYVAIFRKLNQFLPLPFVSVTPVKPKDPVNRSKPGPRPKTTIKKKTTS
jgi:hypothetical protein